ncbi:MAG: M1 family metallopeptidase [Saprospiraceae bacterium]|nr:M1 family metallopeptidase [Saprospiraceae bacterium]MDW8484682.1 M1 family metallopeptidase [Saprospiraceae bacterium]
MSRKGLLFIAFWSMTCVLLAQGRIFTREDTLRGSITAERAWWDVTYYCLNIQVDLDSQYLRGTNTICYRVTGAGQTMQIDLQPPLVLERAEQDGQPLTIVRETRSVYHLQLKKEQVPGAIETLKLWYRGRPARARNAPWDGGFSWAKDSAGRHWVATSCQSRGASIWWPCKDHPSDEPDSQTTILTVRQPYDAISNGRLRRVIQNADSTRTFEWHVQNPINNYGVTLNIAVYAHFADTFQGENGVLTLDYYVLPENLERAKRHFQQVKTMLRAFEYWFGPYPFYSDGYKLVETPFLGMEHQSAIAYGNGYENGYMGIDLSGSGHGLSWDYIIVHESGHEWFANNLTYCDFADMWVHEGFTSYSEGLFVEYLFGKKAAEEYLLGLRRRIVNDSPVIGPYGVNARGSTDMYPKGANLLHTLRQIVNNDSLWRAVLRGLNRDFYHKVVSSSEVEAYLSKHTGKNLQKVFDQYLRHTRIPVLEYRLKKGQIVYRWNNCIPEFNMPVKVSLAPGKWLFLYPTTEWKIMHVPGFNPKSFRVDENFYIHTLEVKE